MWLVLASMPAGRSSRSSSTTRVIVASAVLVGSATAMTTERHRLNFGSFPTLWKI